MRAAYKYVFTSAVVVRVSERVGKHKMGWMRVENKDVKDVRIVKVVKQRGFKKVNDTQRGNRTPIYIYSFGDDGEIRGDMYSDTHNMDSLIKL